MTLPEMVPTAIAIVIGVAFTLIGVAIGYGIATEEDDE